MDILTAIIDHVCEETGLEYDQLEEGVYALCDKNGDGHGVIQLAVDNSGWLVWSTDEGDYCYELSDPTSLYQLTNDIHNTFDDELIWED